MKRLRMLLGKVPTGLLSGITVAAILWLTLAPHPTGRLQIPTFVGADKVAHAVMFAFLALVVLFELMKRHAWQMLPLTTVGLVAFGCSVFGIGIEFAQRAMGMGRGLEVLDMLADAAGAFGMAGVWAAVQKLIAESDDPGPTD